MADVVENSVDVVSDINVASDIDIMTVGDVNDSKSEPVAVESNESLQDEYYAEHLNTLVFVDNDYFAQAAAALCDNAQLVPLPAKYDPESVLVGMQVTPVLVIIGGETFTQEYIDRLVKMGFQSVRVFLYPGDERTFEGAPVVSTFTVDNFYTGFDINGGVIGMIVMDKILCARFPQYENTLTESQRKSINATTGKHLVDGIKTRYKYFDEGVTAIVDSFRGFDIEGELSMLGKTLAETLEFLQREMSKSRVETLVRDTTVAGASVHSVVAGDVDCVAALYKHMTDNNSMYDEKVAAEEAVKQDKTEAIKLPDMEQFGYSNNIKYASVGCVYTPMRLSDGSSLTDGYSVSAFTTPRSQLSVDKFIELLAGRAVAAGTTAVPGCKTFWCSNKNFRKYFSYL